MGSSNLQGHGTIGWYNRIYSYLMRNDFRKSDGDPTLYIKETSGNVLIVVWYTVGKSTKLCHLSS